MRERDLTAAHRRLTRRGERQAQPLTASLDLRNKSTRLEGGLRADLRDGDLLPDLHRLIECGEAQHLLRPRDEATNPWSRHVLWREGERIFVSQPASEWLRNAIHKPRRNPGERRRTRTTVQILITTADCKVCATRIQLNGDNSR